MNEHSPDKNGFCSLQQQSLRFQLPRELRDAIYGFYTHEEDGYRYGHPSRTFRLASGRTLNLLYNYKTAAEELSSVLLEAVIRDSSITFTPAYSDPRHCSDMGYQGLLSPAGRFELHPALHSLDQASHASACCTLHRSGNSQ
jgi:hypothetical protein